MEPSKIDMRPTIDYLLHNYPENLLVQLFINKKGEYATVEEAKAHLQSLKDAGYTSFPPHKEDLEQARQVPAQ